MFTFNLHDIQSLSIILLMLILHLILAKKLYQTHRAIHMETKLLLPKLAEFKEGIPHQTISQLNHWIEENSQILTREFQESWNDFFNHYTKNTKNGSTSIPDVYDYFDEERLVTIRGQRQLFDLAPGIFLGLGIFGTFLGLVIATAGIQANGDSEMLRQGVTSLISGMNTAFYCSIAGIVSSLLWQFFDRNWYYPQLVKNFHLLRSKLDEILPINDDHSILQEMLLNQKKHVEQLETVLSQNIIPQIAKEMSKSLESVFVPHLQQSHAIMNAVVTKSNENQLVGIKEMVDQFVRSLNQLTGDHMKNLESSLRQTVEWQEKVHREMSQLIESLGKSAEKQAAMVNHTTQLTEEIYHYTDRLSEYQSVLENTIVELKETTHKNEYLQAVTSDLLEKMTEERKVFDEQMQHHSQLLQKNVSIINEHTSLQNDLHQKYRQLTEQWNISLSQVRSLTDGHTELLGSTQKQGERFAQIHTQIHSLLHEIKELMKTNQELFTDLVHVQQAVTDERESFSQIQNQIHEHLQQQLNQIDQHASSLQEHWEKTHQLFREVNIQLPQSMEQLVTKLHHGFEHTIQKWGEEFTHSVQNLADEVHTLERSVTQLPNQFDQLNQHMNDFNQKFERSMEEANTTFTKAIQALNKNTERFLQQTGG